MADIEIASVTEHELEKEQHKSVKKVDTRSTVLDKENRVVQKLVEGITKVYGTRENGAHYGTFKTTVDRGPFPDQYKAYLGGAQGDVDFIDLTHKTMGQLSVLAEAATASSGGFILFADYKINSERFYLVCMIKKSPGITIKNLEPEELDRLELDKLSQAARINAAKYAAYLAATPDEKKEINYLSFISNATSKGTSGYFITALGCTKGSTSAQATKMVEVESVRFFDERGDWGVNSKLLRRKIRDYLQAKLGKGESASIKELGEVARKLLPADLLDKTDEIIEEYIRHLNAEEIGIPTEFPVHKSTLRKSTHIKGVTKSWLFEFDRKALGMTDAATVYFDARKKTITLSDIPEEMLFDVESQIKENEE